MRKFSSYALVGFEDFVFLTGYESPLLQTTADQTCHCMPNFLENASYNLIIISSDNRDLVP